MIESGSNQGVNNPWSFHLNLAERTTQKVHIVISKQPNQPTYLFLRRHETIITDAVFHETSFEDANLRELRPMSSCTCSVTEQEELYSQAFIKTILSSSIREDLWGALRGALWGAITSHTLPNWGVSNLRKFWMECRQWYDLSMDIELLMYSYPD